MVLRWSINIVGRSDEFDQYWDLMNDLEIEPGLITYILFEINMNEKIISKILELQSPPLLLDRQKINCLHLYMNGLDWPPERDRLNPKHWHPPPEYAEALRALAELFRIRAPAAQYLWESTLADWPDIAEDLDWALSSEASWNPHESGDWAAHIAIHLTRLADAFIAVGKLGEDSVRFDWQGHN